MPLDYNIIQKYISSSRLQGYEWVCNGNHRKTLKLYQTNLRLSQAFYPLLSLCEVILRNALNEELTNYFNDPDWLKDQLNGFMNHPSLTFFDQRTGKKKTNFFLKNSVEKTIKDLGANATQGKIIADLNFGFWTALFDKTHYSILKGCPIQIFPNLPSGANRSQTYQKMLRIRDYRNRIYHNEAIIFSKDSSGNPVFNLLQAQIIYSDIKEFFEWLNLDFHKWTKRIDTINFEIERANCMMLKYPAKTYYFKRIVLGIRHYLKKYFSLFSVVCISW